MIKLANEIKDTVTSTGGYQLYCILKPYVSTGEEVLISLEDLSPMSSSFMHSSFGQLVDDYGIHSVKSSLKFTKFKKGQINTIRGYFDSISKYQL